MASQVTRPCFITQEMDCLCTLSLLLLRKKFIYLTDLQPKNKFLFCVCIFLIGCMKEVSAYVTKGAHEVQKGVSDT